MRVQNVEIDYFIDYINNKAHIIELKKSPMNALINNINSQFQQELVETESLLNDVLDFDWICYCADGLIIKYRDYNYRIINKKLPFLYSPFVELNRKKYK